MQSNEHCTKEEILKSLRIYYDEPDPESQHFNFAKYADQLFKLIIKLIDDGDVIRNASFAVCLNGEWGSGKTSLLLQVCNRLEKEENDKFKVLWFDAWKYERLDPVLSLLQKIKQVWKKSLKIK